MKTRIRLFSIILWVLLGLLSTGQHVISEEAETANYRFELSLQFPSSEYRLTHIMVETDGSIWIGNNTESALLHLNADGSFIELLGGEDSDVGHFPIPHEIKLAEDGSFWQVDKLDHTILKHVGTDGHVVASVTLPYDVSGIGEFKSKVDRIVTTLDGGAWVEDQWHTEFTGEFSHINMRLQHITADGQLTFALQTHVFVENVNIFGLVVATDGSAWFSDRLNKRILHFSTDGRLLERFGSFGNGIAQFNQPGEITLAVDGALWVLDEGKRVIIDANGIILEKEEGSHRLQKFVPHPRTNLPADYDKKNQLLYLHDIDVDGTHYHATLQNKNGLFQLLTLNPNSNFYTLPNRFDAVTNLLNIPSIGGLEQEYQATLKRENNGYFQIQTLMLK